MMPVAKYQPQSLRIGFLRQNLLNTHEAFLCLAQSILVTRAQPHTWVLSVIAFGESHSEWSKHFLVRNEHQFPSLRIDFTPRTYFVRPTESLFTANNKARNLVPRALFPSLALEAREKDTGDEVAKLAISNSSVPSPGSVFQPNGQMRRNTRRYWTQQILLIVSVPLEGLMMPSKNLCSRLAA